VAVAIEKAAAMTCGIDKGQRAGGPQVGHFS
jgi:hypothetical protein